MQTTDTIESLCADGRAEILARDFKAEPQGAKIERKVEAQSYEVVWDGRRRGRSVTWYRIFVDGVCVASGLKKREAEQKAKALREASV